MLCNVPPIRPCGKTLELSALKFIHYNIQLKIELNFKIYCSFKYFLEKFGMQKFSQEYNIDRAQPLRENDVNVTS
jgi:hypothetical protein